MLVEIIVDHTPIRLEPGPTRAREIIWQCGHDPSMTKLSEHDGPTQVENVNNDVITVRHDQQFSTRYMGSM